jgi:diguanylate cyclase (GGDEF)-like protein/PAS domain S-box-containing protein
MDIHLFLFFYSNAAFSALLTFKLSRATGFLPLNDVPAAAALKNLRGEMPMTPDGGLFMEVLDKFNDGVYLVDEERKIIFWNGAAEKATGYAAEEVVGSFCKDILFRHTNHKGQTLCRADCPLERAFKDLRAREIDLYTYGKNGTKILRRMEFSPLKAASGETVVSVRMLNEANDASSRKRLYEERCRKADHHDKLPSVVDRQYLSRRIEADLMELRRYQWKFGILFVTVDHLDEIITKYGFPYGYRVIRSVTDTIAETVRTSDILGRWNDNEFVVVARNVDLNGLKNLAERIRILVAQSGLTFFKEKLSYTISMGGTMAQWEDTIESLTDRAAIQMHKSVGQGGDVISL